MSPQTLPSETEIRANRAEDVQALEEDARLRNDIRLLGRILGDTVRDQEGADAFDLVESIRQTSIRFHRDEDRLARRELESILDSMSISETVRIVRAFSYFSHLANIAEDQNNIRQMRARTGPGGAPRVSVLAQTLSQLLQQRLTKLEVTVAVDARSALAGHGIPDRDVVDQRQRDQHAPDRVPGGDGRAGPRRTQTQQPHLPRGGDEHDERVPVGDLDQYRKRGPDDQ